MELIELQVLNGDDFEKYLSEGHLMRSMQTTGVYDIWIERKLMCSLQDSPCFSILADECQDISTQEELSICGRWLVNGKPEEHFLTVIHVHSTDARSFTVLLTAEAT